MGEFPSIGGKGKEEGKGALIEEREQKLVVD